MNGVGRLSLMPVNPLSGEVSGEVDSLLLHARDALEVVPHRLRESIEDIIVTLDNYKGSDDSHWPEYRESVPWAYVKQEFASRINLWRENRVVSFQNDDAPKSSMAERAMATLADGGFPSYVISGNVGIHVESESDGAIDYLDSHFLAHPYSAIKGSDDSVVFTILDSRYYPADSYETTLSGTMILTTQDLRERMIDFASENEVYATHLNSFVGE